MSLAMNDVLRRHFDRTRRVARAAEVPGADRLAGARSRYGRCAPYSTTGGVAPPRAARRARPDRVAHGGVFAGTGVDIGTRFLLAHLADAVPDAATAVDLACGTGVVATWLARERAGLRVTATDRSAVGGGIRSR